jgi:short-subunit dehydrogenase
MATQARPFAIVTGASTGIGLELAKLCAARGYDLLIAAEEPAIEEAAATIRATGVGVDVVQADLSTEAGVDQVIARASGRPIGALIANAGRGLGRAFLDQDWKEARYVLDTNVTGTIYLLHELGRQMRAAGTGRILVVGSIAGFMPGTYQAVYNGTKAFLDSFAVALRHELKDSGVTVTCLQPGPTETEFFERADLMDTKVGTDEKMPADEVAKIGFEAMLKGDGDVVAGFKNKLQAAMAHVMPADVVAEQHTKMAKPGTAKH